MGISIVMGINIDSTKESFDELIKSIDKAYVVYVSNHPDKITDIEPLMSFKNSLVMARQEL